MQRPYPLPSDQTQQSVEKFLRNGIIMGIALRASHAFKSQK